MQSQKLNMLYLMRTLLEKTDEHHPMSASDIIADLKKYGMTAYRRTIYSDFETLQQFGLDIIRLKGGYYVGEREFEIPELKLLVDAVQSSRFITSIKSEELL